MTRTIVNYLFNWKKWRNSRGQGAKCPPPDNAQRDNQPTDREKRGVVKKRKRMGRGIKEGEKGKKEEKGREKEGGRKKEDGKKRRKGRRKEKVFPKINQITTM